MNDEGIPEALQEELDALQKAGLSLADAIGDVLAPGGDEIFDGWEGQSWAHGTLQEMNRLFGTPMDNDSTTGSYSTSPSASVTVTEDDTTAARAAPRPPLPPPLRTERRHSIDNSALQKQNRPQPMEVFSQAMETSRRQNAQKSHRPAAADKHFDFVTAQKSSDKRYYFKCVNCNDKVFNKRRRSKVFHLILCSQLSEKVRGAFYYHCSDKGKPPLLKKTVFGMTVAVAKQVAEDVKKKKASLGDGEEYIDLTAIPRFAQFLMAKHKLKPSTRIVDCSEHEHTTAVNLLLEFIIEENIPFAVCDSPKKSYPRSFTRLLAYLRPGFSMPHSRMIGGELLDRFYDETLKEMKSRLRDLLENCRGTLMFDGSEDINGAPMINVLLRVMGTSLLDTKTFFLTTVYTGYDTVDASCYVRIAEKVIKEFVGFNCIAGIVTDNTGSVKNARETMQKEHGRVVASQDQAHVADRLMTDFGEIRWIADTLKTLTAISSDLRRFRKLRARLIELMKAYNLSIQRTRDDENATADGGEGGETQFNTGTREAGVRQDAPGADAAGVAAGEPGSNRDGGSEGEGDGENGGSESPSVASSGFIEDGFDMCNILLANCQADRSTGRNWDVNPDEDDEESIPDETENDRDDEPMPAAHVGIQPASLLLDNEMNEIREPSPRTACTMKKVSAVRFASSEKLLDEYLRLRPVLLQLIDDTLFEGLYTAKSQEEKNRRRDTFVLPIRSEELMVRVKQVHSIFHACRTYLRVFDSETSMSSEVFEATRILEDALRNLPLSFFPEPRGSNRQELLNVFMNRKEGPFRGYKRVKINLLSDLHITAALLDPYRTPIKEDDYMDAFRRHLSAYLSGVDWEELGVDSRDRNEFVEEMISKYANVRSIWRQRGLLRDRSETTGTGTSDVRDTSLSRKLRNSISWWTSGALSKPKNRFARKAVDELIEFARRTLSVSPTATATERTFSLEGRIHSKGRASLNPQKVTKLLFCQWNARVLRDFTLRDEADEELLVERHARNIKKLRQFRSAVSKASEEEKSQNAVGHCDSIDQNTAATAGQGEERSVEAPEISRQNICEPQRHAGSEVPFVPEMLSSPTAPMASTVQQSIQPGLGAPNVVVRELSEAYGMLQGYSQGMETRNRPPPQIGSRERGGHAPAVQGGLVGSLTMPRPQQPPFIPSVGEHIPHWVQTIHTTVAAYPSAVSQPTQPFNSQAGLNGSPQITQIQQRAGNPALDQEISDECSAQPDRGRKRPRVDDK